MIDYKIYLDIYVLIFSSCFPLQRSVVSLHLFVFQRFIFFLSLVHFLLNFCGSFGHIKSQKIKKYNIVDLCKN